jgi:sulfate adenylyltransferase subunit 1
MNTLRFLTAGNVDDGKSTLIGRLLYDSDSIHTDQLGLLKKQTRQPGLEIDLSLITDGLRAEREQGITIDVAYKYFSTKRRKFIIADTPGHVQYTRNMITGASNSDAIIVLIDARKGITPQTKRHTSVASLLGIKKAIIAINKMDLLGYSEKVYRQIVEDFEAIKSSLNFTEILYVPVSALAGDNIVTYSTQMPWYEGQPLLTILEELEIPTAENLNSRFQVQWVIRPKDDEYHDYRGYAGPVLSGQYAVGDTVTILPANIQTTITHIEHNLSEVPHAKAGQNIVLRFADQIDISRGDTIIRTNETKTITEGNQINSWISWMDHGSLQMDKTYILQHRFKNVRVRIQSINKKWDVNNWAFESGDQLGLNDIAQVTIKTNQPLFYDAYLKNQKSGSAILIDETTFNTVGSLLFLEN